MTTQAPADFETDDDGGTAASALSGYHPAADGLDEMMAGGQPRAHWRRFAAALDAMPPGTLTQRRKRGKRLLRENGVTYHLHGDPAGQDRPWLLDPIPLVMSGTEWARLAEGLEQRARLLDALLADLYGERRVLETGLLPSALVLGHPAYLRACRGLQPAGGSHLPLYAADVVRGPDGAWCVVGDLCEAPAGLGYALENRQVIASVMSDEFRAEPVEPLQPFLEALRGQLAGFSPRRFDTPRLALLTPGPHHETFFEHVYLARLLGCILVESQDLSMRDGRLFLKTLDGLKTVDVVLRRTTGANCDPLELNGTSLIGVPGLVQAARNGAVAVVNALGSGVLESPALPAFLPALSRHLLGEELRLPSVEALWCGDAEQRRHALERRDALLFRPAHDLRAAPLAGAALDAALDAAPHAVAAQARIVPSSAPVWGRGGLEARPVVLRVFLAAASGGGYTVMPGGLARFSDGEEIVGRPFHGGRGGSKDVWVLADGPSAAPSPVRGAAVPVTLTRGGRDLPSRVADNLFWFGRYLERCENTTRMLRAAFAYAEDSAHVGRRGNMAVRTLLRPLGVVPPAGQHSAGQDTAAAMAALGRLHFAADGSINGLRATLERLNRAAVTVRDRLSIDTWRSVQELGAQIAALTPAAAADYGEAQSGLNAVVLALEAASGLSMENMTRGLGWRFLDIGRRLERATHIIELLANAAESDADDEPVVLDVLLAVFDSVMTYRARYLSAPQFAPVLDLLMCDESNPRALGFQFAALLDHMERLVAHRDAAQIRPEQRLMVFLSGTVRTADIEILAARTEDGRRYDLAQVLEVLRSRLWELSEALAQEYFTLATRRATPWRPLSS